MDYNIDRISNVFKLNLVVSDDQKLVTQTPPTINAPPWGLHQSLQGRRDYAHVFRLPNKGGWIKKWVYSRISPTEYVPESALDNCTAESTTILRIRPSYIFPMMSSHWFLCPFQSVDGYTIGLCYMDVTVNNLDQRSVHPESCGRFAMDEATGEVFMTAWCENNRMIVGWTETVSSCERVREIFLFEAPRVDGEPPRKLLLQNSFYERRDCRICNDSPNVPVCRAPASRQREISGSSRSTAFLFPLKNVYRRFRGCFYGVVVKTVYNHSFGQLSTRSVNSEPIVCDIRHSVASVSRRLRINIRYGASSFGIGPAVGARILALDTRHRITADSPGSSEVSSDEATSSHSGGAGGGSVTGDVKRRRNADNVHDRDSAEHKRRLRNRESAARANVARKLRMEATETELKELKQRVPELRRRRDELQEENKLLKQQVLEPRRTPGDCIDIEGVFGFPDDDAFFR